MASRRDPTRRFTDRVDAYVRARPDYPQALLEHLLRECALEPGDPVADVGSGTGIWAAQLLAAGLRVLAVEPNEAMRGAAERRLGSEAGFTSVDGSAEATGLAGGSIALVTAAQAFHWFDLARARVELARILRPGGRVAAIWNERRTESSPFLRGYEALLRAWGTDYAEVDHTRFGRREMESFFAPRAVEEVVFPHHQSLDLAGLEARLASSSYLPAPGHPRHAGLLEAARRLFEEHQRDGTVRIDYDTRLFLGRLRPRRRAPAPGR